MRHATVIKTDAPDMTFGHTVAQDASDVLVSFHLFLLNLLCIDLLDVIHEVDEVILLIPRKIDINLVDLAGLLALEPAL